MKPPTAQRVQVMVTYVDGTTTTVTFTCTAVDTTVNVLDRITGTVVTWHTT